MATNSTKIKSPLTVDYAKLFLSLPSAYIVVAADDPVFTILEENDAHAQIAMVKRNKVIGKPLLKVFPDTSEQYTKTGESLVLESIKKVISSGKPDVMPHLKYDLKDTTGQFINKYWSLVHYPIFDESGKVTAVYQATNDITDTVLTAQKSKLREYQLTQALASGSIATWVWDIENNIVKGDENLARIFGLPVEQTARGLPLDKFITSIHPEDRECVKKEIERVLKSHEVFDCEYRTIDNNDNVRWVVARGRVEPDDHSKPVNFPGIIIDITERKNAQNNIDFLTKASNLFSESLNYAETLRNIATMAVPHIADWCAIDLLDENGLMQQVTVAHKDPEKVAWAKELRVKQGPPDLNAPTGAPKVIRTGEPEFYPYINEEMLATSVRTRKELKLLRALNISSAMIVPLKINNKTRGAMTFIATESRVHYKPSELELAKGLTNRAAQAIYNAELFAAAQHEVKERELLQKQLLLANSALESRVLKRTKQLEITNKGLENEIIKRQQAEDSLQEHSNELTRSNQELQDFAYGASHDLQEPLRKIQAFGDVLESEFGKDLGEGIAYLNRMRNAASRMSGLIEDLLAFSRVTTQPHLKVAVNLNAIVCDVEGDLETRIERTKGRVEIQPLPTVWADPTHMRQLFQNLIGNALKFHRPGVPPVVKVYANPPNPSTKVTTICIEDNGIGFDEKYLDRIFSVFQRLHGRDSYEGTGIGLAVCRKIAERYGGTITAASKKGKGSTFLFNIPIRGEELGDGSS